MIRNKFFAALLSALALVPTGMKLTAEPVIFFFSGQITERRAINSVFTEPNTDQFYGYFSYETAATHFSVTAYPLLSFSIDGNSLNFTNYAFPFGPPGISLSSSGAYPVALDTMSIHGLYPPANSGPYDLGDVSIWLVGSTGFAFTTNGLPSTLNLSSFRLAYVGGPVWEGPPPGFGPFDQGTITQLIQIPEPAAWGLLGLGLLAAWRRSLRRVHLR